ncbi:hypothetical protein EYF80_014342 [Liparis tanakae]|uniref:Uncharacterized protein n=1 Tax=Liparis tanakae TaxID=230148 RepID=A0A4Z2IC94_9TELE|nr:hypothetical protein EYF80_014342 [Liparis tanakae]
MQGVNNQSDLAVLSCPSSSSSSCGLNSGGCRCFEARKLNMSNTDLLEGNGAEAVAATVPGAVQLLQQEDHGLVDDAQHPQPVHACQERTGEKPLICVYGDASVPLVFLRSE